MGKLNIDWNKSAQNFMTRAGQVWFQAEQMKELKRKQRDDEARLLKDLAITRQSIIESDWKMATEMFQRQNPTADWRGQDYMMFAQAVHAAKFGEELPKRIIQNYDVRGGKGSGDPGKVVASLGLTAASKALADATKELNTLGLTFNIRLKEFGIGDEVTAPIWEKAFEGVSNAKTENDVDKAIVEARLAYSKLGEAKKGMPFSDALSNFLTALQSQAKTVMRLSVSHNAALVATRLYLQKSGYDEAAATLYEQTTDEELGKYW